MLREINVAITMEGDSGKINDRSLPVSSIIKTMAEIGPWVVAANTAPAHRGVNTMGWGK